MNSDNSKLIYEVNIRNERGLYVIKLLTKRGIFIDDQYLYCSKEELETIADKIKEALNTDKE